MELSQNLGRERLLFQFTSQAIKLSRFPDLCKVLEIIIRKQVFSFLDQKGCLNSTQHGFRPGRSCLSALFDVFDNIMHMLDSNSSVDMVYLDFSKAFDKVVVVYPLPWPLLVGGVRCSRLWSTSQLLRPSGQQCSHSGGVCPQIQGRQCGAYVGAVEEMMCVVCVDVTEGA